MTEQTEAREPATSPPPSPSPGRAYLAEKDRTMSLKGKSYLQVADRVYAFRLDHPITSGWQIVTEIIAGSFPEKWVIWESRIIDPNGKVVATGHKQEEPPASSMGCADWVDKGETGAIGRALGNCGYGTLAALEEDPNSPCDAPRERGPQRPASAATRPAVPAAAKTESKPSDPAEPAPPCVVCGKPVDNVGRVNYCKSKDMPISHPEPACSKDPKAQKGSETK